MSLGYQVGPTLKAFDILVRLSIFCQCTKYRIQQVLQTLGPKMFLNSYHQPLLKSTIHSIGYISRLTAKNTRLETNFSRNCLNRKAGKLRHWPQFLWGRHGILSFKNPVSQQDQPLMEMSSCNYSRLSPSLVIGHHNSSLHRILHHKAWIWPP